MKLEFNSHFRVVRAEKEHIAELVRMRLLLQEHMEKSNNNILKYTSEWKCHLTDYFNQLLENENAAALIAIDEISNKIVGMMVAYENVHEHFTVSRSVKIDDVWVDVGYRKLGICKSLLKELTYFYGNKHIDTFMLNFVVKNIEAEKTWESLGFQPIVIQNIVSLKDLKL